MATPAPNITEQAVDTIRLKVYKTMGIIGFDGDPVDTITKIDASTGNRSSNAKLITESIIAYTLHTKIGLDVSMIATYTRTSRSTTYYRINHCLKNFDRPDGGYALYRSIPDLIVTGLTQP